MWSGFQANKLNIRWELEPEPPANQAEPENQVVHVTGPDPPKKNSEF